MPPNQEREIESLKTELSLLQSKVVDLEDAKDAIDKMYKEEVIDCEHVKAELKDETQKLNNMHGNFQNLELRFRAVQAANKKIDKKHQQISAELKILKSEKEDLNRGINISL